MPSFNIKVPHQQSRDSATKKLKKFSEIVLADLPTGISDVDQHWTDHGSLCFGFKAMGMEIRGEMTVDQNEVQVGGKMPFAALPFRGAIEGQIREQLAKALA